MFYVGQDSTFFMVRFHIVCAITVICFFSFLNFHGFAHNSSSFRVGVKDWGADFRKLSAGAALGGLTLWLDHMQASSLSISYCLLYIFD